MPLFLIPKEGSLSLAPASSQRSKKPESVEQIGSQNPEWVQNLRGPFLFLTLVHAIGALAALLLCCMNANGHCDCDQ